MGSPAAIKSDFSKRYPSAEITSFMNYSDGIDQIEFKDPEQNEALISYVNDSWKMTYTEISDIQQLPIEVQTSFLQAGYIGVQNIKIFKTERAGITRPPFTRYISRIPGKNTTTCNIIFISMTTDFT